MSEAIDAKTGWKLGPILATNVARRLCECFENEIAL
jgi:hypothetical protein